MRRVLAFLPLCLVLLAPAAAPAHDGWDGDRDGRHHRHHSKVLLAGTVKSVDASAGTVVVDVTRTNRRGRRLDDRAVTVSVRRVWVADTNSDDRRTLADVAVGDKVFVKARRRNVDFDAGVVRKAKLYDATRSPARSTRDGFGDRDCDRRT